MSISTIVFLIFGFASLIAAFIMEGGSPAALLAVTAAMIVFGGTIGAVGVSFPISRVKKVPQYLKVFFTREPQDKTEIVGFFYEISQLARKNGLLALEETIRDDARVDRFTQKGLRMVIDGVEPELIKATLELECDSISERHDECSEIFIQAAGFSPTMGVIGTVMGLVHVLSNLEEPSTLGPKIAVAFIATLYGVGFANLLWMPIGHKLKALDADEYKRNRMIIEGILAVQLGRNPRMVVDVMKAYLEKSEQLRIEEMVQ